MQKALKRQLDAFEKELSLLVARFLKIQGSLERPSAKARPSQVAVVDSRDVLDVDSLAKSHDVSRAYV